MSSKLKIANIQLEKYIKGNNKIDCCEKTTEKKIIFEDGKSANLTLENKKEETIYKIKTDSCLVEYGYKCDWIASLENNQKVALIELKSRLNRKKIEDIVKQFKGTIETVLLNKKDCFCILVAKINFPKHGNKRQKIQSIMGEQELSFKSIFNTQEKERKMTIKEIFY